MRPVVNRDWDGRKELDPQCAPDVTIVYTCHCESCGHQWDEEHEPESCPNCNESSKDAFVYHEEQV